MKKHIFTALVLMFSLFILIWSGCKKDDDPEFQEFIIKIDSIVHADTINFGNDLSIKFYGLIGEDDCYSFDRLVTDYVPGELAVTSWGIHTSSENCTPSTVYMNGAELLVSEIPAGNILIVAVQPDGSKIEQNVFVKE